MDDFVRCPTDHVLVKKPSERPTLPSPPPLPLEPARPRRLRFTPPAIEPLHRFDEDDLPTTSVAVPHPMRSRSPR